MAEGTAGAVGDAFLRSLVRHVALAFDARLMFGAEATEPDGAHVRVVSCWYDGDWVDEPFEYDTRGQPCALVVEQAVVAFRPRSRGASWRTRRRSTWGLRATCLVEVVDDGRGGADPAAGTGLRGRADRIDALGGRLEVDSPAGAGTRVSARLPLVASG